MSEPMMTLETNFFDSALKNAARMEARQHCIEGWASISEGELAATLYEFAHKIVGDVMKANELLTKQLADYLTTRPFVMPKEPQ